MTLRLVCFLTVALASAPAAIISAADGTTLAGGTMTGYWADGVSQTFVITASPGTGRVDQAGAFNFRVSDSTLDNLWFLTNNRVSPLVGFTLNLVNAITSVGTAVFDSGATPTAPGSPGSALSSFGAPVLAVNGGTISAFAFTTQYTGVGGANIFGALTVSLGGGGLSQGSTFTFHADSDIMTATGVPEGNMWIPTLALLTIGLIRRRR